MKTTFLLSIPLLLIFGINTFENSGEGTQYYFCASKMMNPGNLQSHKQEVYYSAIKIIENNEQKIWDKVKQWKNKVYDNNFCRLNGCTVI